MTLRYLQIGPRGVNTPTSQKLRLSSVENTHDVRYLRDEDNDDDHVAMGSMERTRELNLLRRR